jgi:DNA-directed RNA polymerase specialized sigma24 family protein
MSKWSRKLVIANSLNRVAADLRRSAQRTRSGSSDTKPAALPLPEWPADHAVSKAQLQNALAAIDLFPRCAVLLTVFEKLSTDEASVLLGVDKKLVMNARTTGLTRLAYNLAIEQGWHADSVQSPESTLAAMKAAV